MLLGIQISRDKETKTIKLSQTHYIDKIITKFGLQNANPISTPRIRYRTTNNKTGDCIRHSSGSSPHAYKESFLRSSSTTLTLLNALYQLSAHFDTNHFLPGPVT